MKRIHFVRRTILALAASLILVAPAQQARAQGKPLVIFAAASLKNALDDVNAAWAAQHRGQTAAISYAASGVLAKQIEAAAPADLFISADEAWMDYVAKRNLIKPGTRADLLGNAIVLIAPKDSPLKVNIAPGLDLAKLLAGGRLSLGAPESVPAGKYGKEALEKLGSWDGVKDHLALADNVRAGMLLVSRGEAPLGIVYQTDAAADPSVRVVGTFPENSHTPVIYPVAVTKDSTNPDAAAFLAFLRGDAAKAAFAKQGFTVLAPGS